MLVILNIRAKQPITKTKGTFKMYILLKTFYYYIHVRVMINIFVDQYPH